MLNRVLRPHFFLASFWPARHQCGGPLALAPFPLRSRSRLVFRVPYRLCSGRLAFQAGAFVFLPYVVIPNPSATFADGVRDLLLPLPSYRSPFSGKRQRRDRR
jgi:hypothetical protein